MASFEVASNICPPQLLGDPGVFKALADRKTDDPPCWQPASFDGIEAGG
jgi:hypothetical protein